MKKLAIQQNFFQYGPWLLVLAAAAILLKLHYAAADSMDLEWILAPTARMVEWLSGIAFEAELYAGYVSRSHGVIIAPACAGVNFLIIALLMAGALGIFQLKAPAARGAWLFFSFAAGLGLTVCANALRIILSVALHEADIYSAGLTPAGVHRFMGAGLYLVSLYLYFYLLQCLLRICAGLRQGRAKDAASAQAWTETPAFHRLLPLICYLFITVGVPLVSCPGAFAQRLFLTHSGVVVGLGAAVYGGVLLAELCFLKFIRRIGRHETDHSCC
jgi:exosortase K